MIWNTWLSLRRAGQPSHTEAGSPFSMVRE